MRCKICGQELKHSLGLSSHLRHNHKEYTVKSYYDAFFKKANEGQCIICGKPTKFITITDGYRKHCSSKCSQQDENVRQYIHGRKSQYSEKLLNSEYNKRGYHVYRYDFPYNEKIYHYVGHTLHSQIERISNHYNDFMQEIIDYYGKETFLLNYCKIVKWFDNKIEATDYEEQLNIQVKEEFGEENVLSIANGRKPSNKCLQGAINHQKENGSWNKGKQLSLEHRQAISNGGKKAQKLRYLREMLECITLYLDDNFTNPYRIQRYIKQHYDKTFLLNKETIVPYIEIINYDINILEKGNYG